MRPKPLEPAPRPPTLLVPAIIVGVAILAGFLLLRSSLEKSAAQLDAIRLGISDTRQALTTLAQARPSQAPPPRSGPDPERRYAVNTSGAPAIGLASAKIKIVEFSDFQ